MPVGPALRDGHRGVAVAGTDVVKRAASCRILTGKVRQPSNLAVVGAGCAQRVRPGGSDLRGACRLRGHASLSRLSPHVMEPKDSPGGGSLHVAPG